VTGFKDFKRHDMAIAVQFRRHALFNIQAIVRYDGA
jgi:hypothetical protein